MPDDDLTGPLDFLQVRVDAARTAPEAFDMDGLMGEVGRYLSALDEVLKLTRGWESNAPDVPYIDRETAALAVQATIRAALSGVAQDKPSSNEKEADHA